MSKIKVTRRKFTSYSVSPIAIFVGVLGNEIWNHFSGNGFGSFLWGMVIAFFLFMTLDTYGEIDR